MNKFFTAFLFFIMSSMLTMAQSRTDDKLKHILSTIGDPVFKQVLNDPHQYRLQIIYTQIDRDKKNVPSFRHYYFNYDPSVYFNPASTVKLPLAALALEKLHTIEGIDKYTTVVFDSSYEKQTSMYTDETAENKLPSIAHFIRRAFLISENDPYNRLYQFVGQQQLHQSLWQKGYEGLIIPRQFMGFTVEQNKRTNPVKFLDAKGNVIYSQPMLYNPDPIDFGPEIKLGKAHINSNDELVPEPFNFTGHNRFTLQQLQLMLQSIIFPHSVNAGQRFNISEDDRRFLLQYLSQYPSETPYPYYDAEKFYDSYAKFFFRNKEKPIRAGTRVFNKTGWAYGFLSDVSYVADFENKIEYMLTATLYVNSDGILNDGKYEYDEIGYPFLYQLGQGIHEYELQRKRKHKPDLSALKINYEKRDPRDKRKAISEVDN